MKYQSEQDFLKKYNPNDFDRPSVTADILIFSVSTDDGADWRRAHRKNFGILLVRRDEYPDIGKWNLPGGFVGIHELAADAAGRVLRTETGVTDNVYLEQLYTFDGIKRDPRMRVFSIAYMALLDKSKLHYAASRTSEWFNITDNGLESENGTIIKFDDLAFDHAEIIKYGLGRLRNKIEYTDIVFNMMPREFTLGELQQVYEAVLGRTLLPADFRRRIRDRVVATGKMQSGFGHRPAALFKYKG
jgi:ADP-ribose pyrophosphatase YjhB (NUDIX family)